MNRLGNLIKDLLSEKVYLINAIYTVCAYAYVDKRRGVAAAQAIISRCKYEVR